MPKQDQPTFYTRAGDNGTTNLYGQVERVPKYAPRPTACGEIDEAQAVLGLLRASSGSPRTRELLERIERDLYRLMGELAAAEGVQSLASPIDAEDVTWLEEATDELTALTAGFAEFVLPGDSTNGALGHLARTVVRRAERSIARLLHENELQNPAIMSYMNRLSSLLYVLALHEDREAGINRPTFARKR